MPRRRRGGRRGHSGRGRMRRRSLRTRHRRAIRRGDNRDRFARVFHMDYAANASLNGGGISSLEGLTQATGGDSCYYFTFMLYDVYTLTDPSTTTAVAGLSNYASLYDQFKLCAVKMTFTPRADMTVETVGTAANVTSDPLISIIDNDGQSSSTTSYIQAVNDGRAKRHFPRKKWSVYFKPTILIPVLTGPTATTVISGNNIAMRPRYESSVGVSTLANNIQHFGLLVQIPKGSLTQYWDISCSYYVSMKHRLI